MSYVRRRVSIEPIIAVAFVDAPLDVSTIEKKLGAKIDSLASDHEEQVRAVSAGTRFRETTPIRHLPTCAP